MEPHPHRRNRRACQRRDLIDREVREVSEKHGHALAGESRASAVVRCDGNSDRSGAARSDTAPATTVRRRARSLAVIRNAVRRDTGERMSELLRGPDADTGIDLTLPLSESA